MKQTVIAICIFVMISPFVYGQTVVRQFTFELSGSVLYNYSNLTWGPYPGESFERFTRRQSVTFQPGVGYFATRELELMFEPHYSYRFFQQNSGEYQTNETVREIVFGQWTHNVGLSVGPAYNYPAGDRVVIFGGILFGVSWTYFGYDPPSVRLGSPWKKPEISFPQILGGARVFFTDNWATVFSVQYSRTTNYYGYDDQTNTELALGLGLSVFL